MSRLQRSVGLAVLAVFVSLVLSACGGGDDSASDAAAEQSPTAAESTTASGDLEAVKGYLLDHTGRLTGFTSGFKADADAYYELARAAGFDTERLWTTNRREVSARLAAMKRHWVEGNPYYERVEGIVAGTPSLAEFDVILDAGSSAAEDPASAVPFDLRLPDGRVLAKPGNFFNLTEGALWGTLPDHLADEVAATPTDLDGNGRVEFGEVLPHPGLLQASAVAFDRYARDLAEAAAEWQPSPSDAFTALVVMVPTMSEYFGQWKESRFVRGSASGAESFNVVSRLSDVRDILTGLEVIYDGVEPIAAKAGEPQSAQTREELSDLRAFVADLYAQERAGERFRPEQADALGAEAQERATAIAGQVSQIAAELEIPIEQ